MFLIKLVNQCLCFLSSCSDDSNDSEENSADSDSDHSGGSDSDSDLDFSAQVSLKRFLLKKWRVTELNQW